MTPEQLIELARKKWPEADWIEVRQPIVFWSLDDRQVTAGYCCISVSRDARSLFHATADTAAELATKVEGA